MAFSGANTDLDVLGAKAKAASRVMATASTGKKNEALAVAAELIGSRTAEILEANSVDLEKASNEGVAATGLDRLRLNEARISSMADGLRQVAGLADPVGQVDSGWVRPNGLRISKVRVPLGVIGIVYALRPAMPLCCADLPARFHRI